VKQNGDRRLLRKLGLLERTAALDRLGEGNKGAEFFRHEAAKHSEFKGPVRAVNHATQDLVPRNSNLRLAPIG